MCVYIYAHKLYIHTSFYPISYLIPIISANIGINNVDKDIPAPKYPVLKAHPVYKPFNPFAATISLATVICSITPAGEIPYVFRAGSENAFFCTTERTTSDGILPPIAPKQPAKNPPPSLATVG